MLVCRFYCLATQVAQENLNCRFFPVLKCWTVNLALDKNKRLTFIGSETNILHNFECNFTTTLVPFCKW